MTSVLVSSFEGKIVNRIPEEMRNEMIRAMKRRWDECNKEYQLLSLSLFNLDTVHKVISYHTPSSLLSSLCLPLCLPIRSCARKSFLSSPLCLPWFATTVLAGIRLKVLSSSIVVSSLCARQVQRKNALLVLPSLSLSLCPISLDSSKIVCACRTVVSWLCAGQVSRKEACEALMGRLEKDILRLSKGTVYVQAENLQGHSRPASVMNWEYFFFRKEWFRLLMYGMSGMKDVGICQRVASPDQWLCHGACLWHDIDFCGAVQDFANRSAVYFVLPIFLPRMLIQSVSNFRKYIWYGLILLSKHGQKLWRLVLSTEGKTVIIFSVLVSASRPAPSESISVHKKNRNASRPLSTFFLTLSNHPAGNVLLVTVGFAVLSSVAFPG